MSTTVAVALITALSTLTAAALTGAISAWQHGRQLRHQRVLAREERTEKWADGQRARRREAYEHLLSRVDRAYRVLDEGWSATPFTEYPRWEAGFAARRALDEATIRVRLEGPPDMAEQADALVRSVEREFRAHRRVLDAHPGATSSAAHLDRAAHLQALDMRTTANSAFVSAARQTLDQRPSTTSPEVS